MILPYSLHRTHEDDVFFAVRQKQREMSEDAFKTLSAKHLERTEKSCTLAQVKEAFGSRPCITTSYFINDFIENLTFTSGDVDFELTIAQFPKEKKNHAINLMIGKHLLHHSISSKNTPESVAEFMEALIGWFPEYVAIEERVERAEKQKEIACEIADDALKRTMTPILEEKGYMNFSFSTFKETAHIDVQFNGGVSISINVELLEDFLDDTMNVLQSLPQF
jgi:hypothetical protein